MLQVLTNSSADFGLLDVCVSRSEMWMTFTPLSIAISLNVSRSMARRSAGLGDYEGGPR